MPYMLLHILCGLVFTQTLRYSQRRRAAEGGCFQARVSEQVAPLALI